MPTRGDELTNLTTDKVQELGNELIIRIPYNKIKTKEAKMFVLSGRFAEIVRAYSPATVTTNRFFLQLRNGKCTNQVICKNCIAKIPKEIAKYLGLPDHDLYTGHSFRRTSTTILADTDVGIETLKRHGPWKSNTVCEGYIQESVAQKRKIGNLIANAVNLPSTSKDTSMSVESPPKKSATSTSVESTSQIVRISASGVDFGGQSGVAFGVQSGVSFPFNKENIIFHFSGSITNLNVNTKE